MPSLQQLRYLVAIAETLHFRKAAERVHVTQPTLSGQLSELEKELGVRLVERSRSRVALTPTGENIVARARVVLHGVEEIVDLAERGQGKFGGLIRLGTLHSLGPYLLPHILPELHDNYPDLRMYVREDLPGNLVKHLEEGRLDLLIFPLPAPGADLAHARLFREPLLVAAPRDHRLAAIAEAKHQDLRGETILALERGHRLHEQVRRLCEQFGANLALDYEGTSLDTLRQMVAMGMGLAFLPALYVRSEVRNEEEVIVRRFSQRTPSRVVGMVWRRQSDHDKDYLEIARIIRQRLKQHVPEVSVA